MRAGARDGQVSCGTEGGNDSCQGEICQTNPMCDGMSLGKEKAHEGIMSGNL